MERPAWLDMVGDVAPIVEPADFPAAPDVLVTLDAASLDGVGSLPTGARANEIVVIDHHVTNPASGRSTSSTHAASRRPVAYRLIRR
jgi:phosphoesterase RecJ-like protein